MKKNLKTIFFHPEYDLLVIGGGINGAAIANIAAHQGLKVALIDKEDFAGGTSSRSTKLLHGGLRYLENFQFGLVRESLRERYIQWKNIPYLVKPIRFVIPVYRGGSRPFWMIRLGVALYDRLCGEYRIEPHRVLTAAEVGERVPGLQDEGLIGGVEYTDCQMDDSRICLENVLSARAAGAHVSNYVKAQRFIKVATQLTAGAVVRDEISGEELEIRAHHVICAAGPWTNEVFQKEQNSSAEAHKVRLTKGVHVVYRDKISDRALLLQAGRDKRIFFVIPFGEHSLIGTTDTDFYASPDHPEAEKADIDYLLEECARFFSTRKFSRDRIITTFAGLRPLVSSQGDPSRVSREHIIEKSPGGVLYVMGGKYTTYRAIAQQCVEKILGHRLNLGENHPFFGTLPVEGDVEDLKNKAGLSDMAVERLFGQYGNRAAEILRLVAQDAVLGEALCSCSPVIKAQAVYAVEQEMAKTADDLIWRRLNLAYRPCATQQCRRWIEGYLKNLS